jgi:structural maintenance of chromosome 3 (chondroitin sulfate proteoglycan 6)
MQSETMDLERLASKLSLLIKKKEECLKATRNLGLFDFSLAWRGKLLQQTDFFQSSGVLLQDAYDINNSTKELYVRLEECNQELKKLSHVNKKAMDQYMQFGEH